MLTVEKFELHSAAEFLLNESLLYFEHSRNNVAFLHRQTSTSNPDKAGSLQRLLEILKPTKFTTAKIKTLYHPSRPTDFFTTQILGAHVTSHDQGLFSQRQGRQRRETLGTRLAKTVGACNASAAEPHQTSRQTKMADPREALVTTVQLYILLYQSLKTNKSTIRKQEMHCKI